MKPLFVSVLDDVFFRSHSKFASASYKLMEFIDSRPDNASCLINMNIIFNRMLRGEISWNFGSKALLDLEACFFAGLHKRKVERAASVLAQALNYYVSPFLFDLFQKLRKNYTTVLLSDSCHEIVSALGRLWGFDYYQGSILEVDNNGVYNGNIDKIKKVDFLNQLVEANKCTWKDSVGIGKNIEDIDFLQKCQFPIFFNPTQPVLFKSSYATKTGNIVVFEDFCGYIFISGKSIFVDLLKKNMCKMK